jgi:hypothetical protein
MTTQGEDGVAANEREKSFTYRVGNALSTQVANAVAVIIVGVAASAYGSLSRDDQVRNILFGVIVVLFVVTIGTQIWLRNAFLRLRRANAKGMADPGFYDVVRRRLERDLTVGYEDIAAGRWRVFASEVPRESAQLLRDLHEVPGANKILRAADLTTNPQLLETRSEYLAENRRFIASGGVIKRLYVVWRRDLESAEFAVNILALIGQHRSIGVQCGLVVRDRLRPDQAVDFVVFGTGAVLIEEEQGDADYVSGRSSVEFRSVARWIDTFDQLWPLDGLQAPVTRLQQYEATARRLLDGESWDAMRIGKALDSVD